MSHLSAEEHPGKSGRAKAGETLRGRLVGVSLQDLMDTLTGYAEAVGYPLKSPTFLPQPGDGWVLSRIDLRVRMGMFEEELTPVVPAIFGLTGSENAAEHPVVLG